MVKSSAQHEFDTIVNKMAGDYVTFLDEIIVLEFSFERCWQCGRELSSNIQFLGVYDAVRKKKPPSLKRGAWSGHIARLEPEMVYRSVTHDKWDKAKNYL